MRRKTLWIFVFSFFLLAATASTAAAQSGQAAAPDFSAHAEVEHVAHELEDLWAQDPKAFAGIDAARDYVADWYIHSGHRPLNVARLLEGLGEERLLLMLWALASDDPFEIGIGLRAWRAWRVGLLDAVGQLRDERSIPVLFSILEGQDPHRTVHQAAASAIGKVGDVDSILGVVDIARESSEKRGPIIAGLGHARRFAALEYLLEVAQSPDDARHHRVAIRAMGDWANQWAWQTSTRRPHIEEGQKGQSAVIATLIDLYPEADASLRTEITKSLQLAGAAEAQKILEERTEATDDEQQRQLYGQLAQKMARSPLN